jgi:single-stranded DNA-binding protein
MVSSTRRLQCHQIIAWGAQAEFVHQYLNKDTRVKIIGQIDQLCWGKGENRQYKTVLIANEIVLVRSP